MLSFKKYRLLLRFHYSFLLVVLAQSSTPDVINLAGTWHVKLDRTDVGEQEQWFNKFLNGTITLPGSLTTNNIGDDVSLSTPWTGDIIDSSFFTKPQYAKYRTAENFKVPFWLQPTKYYKGAAWYQKEVTIPQEWNHKYISLFLERCHWKTTVWIDDKKTGSCMSLGTPHEYNLSSMLTPGKHRITICIDNRVHEVNPGPNSHSISDHTQTNWNGMVGKLVLVKKPLLHIENVKLFPDINKNQVTVLIDYKKNDDNALKASVSLQATSGNRNCWTFEIGVC